MITPESLLQRIDELLLLRAGSDTLDVVGEVYLGTITIATQLYGADSSQVAAIKQLHANVQKSNWSEGSKAELLTKQCQGALRSIASDIRGGRLGSLLLQYQGEVFADFLRAARAALDVGRTDVAAVLASAALEDSLKRLAQANGLKVDDKDMATVVAALKTAGLVPASQAALLKGMTQLRNKAFHAEWAKLDASSVSSAISFVEQLLTTHFA